MQKHESFGFVRVGVAVPQLKVADCSYNAARMIELMKEAEENRVAVLVFPELCVTAYTCADLFQQESLRKSAIQALELLCQASKEVFHGLVFAGLPVVADDQLFNCAAAIKAGEILAIVPKSFIPNYKEFYERRWFAPAENARVSEINLSGKTVPFGADILFDASDRPGLAIGVEICEDLWVPIPPSSYQALAGATLLVNLSASNELIGKAAYRRQLVSNQSGRCMAAYAYSSCGISESSTDLVFSGHCLIVENGVIVSENERFEKGSVLQFADIDFGRLASERLHANSFGDNKRQGALLEQFRRVKFNLGTLEAPAKLAREIEAHPFVPRGHETLASRCQEIFKIQVAALHKRLDTLGLALNENKVVIGVSGGLDSTLSVLVLCKTMDQLGLPHSRILAYTLPGFGTTSRTRSNAVSLMRLLGLEMKELDIRRLCFDEMVALGHKPFGIEIKNMDLDQFCARLEELPAGSQDLVFENVQARMRTAILMNSGFVVGTGDLSELALGWCTYNADHMSMYNPNCSIPKTLVKFLVDWVADHEFAGEIRTILKDIVATDISPELLPRSRDGKISQKTESFVGPYELNDFFLFHLLRYGMAPSKILYLASQARFDREYAPEEMRSCLISFLKRFFRNQFKRSCLPDGPKVGSVSLSPRGDWRMPSDAEATAWIDSLLEKQAPEQTDEAGPSTQAQSAAPAPVIKRALGLVDPLNAFGSAKHSDGRGHYAELPVEGGEEVGPAIAILQAMGTYEYCFAGVDEHPESMFNFASSCPGKKPFLDKVPDRDGNLAVVFPDHCQKGSWSAAFLPGIREDLIDEIFPKGNQKDKDSHSICGNPELLPRLKALGITDVDLVGLVFRICVGLSAIDLVKAGFKVRVIVDCTRDLELAEYAYVIAEMEKQGVEMITSLEVLASQ